MHTKPYLFAILFGASLSAHAAMLDLGLSTLDTDTGLEWLDLTETVGLSYRYISNNMQKGEKYENWRYATSEEVFTLWENLGISSALTSPLLTGTQEYSNFLMAVDLLGNTWEKFETSLINVDYGFNGLAFTGSFVQLDQIGLIHRSGASSTELRVSGYGYTPNVYEDQGVSFIGSYLVAVPPMAVPPPSSGYLFITAVLGLLSRKHLLKKTIKKGTKKHRTPS